MASWSPEDELRELKLEVDALRAAESPHVFAPELNRQASAQLSRQAEALTRTYTARERVRKEVAQELAKTLEDQASAIAADLARVQAEILETTNRAVEVSEFCSVSHDDALTLVCLDDGATVQVPLSVAKAESELLENMLEDVDESGGDVVLHVPWLGGEQAASFATFLSDPLLAPTQDFLNNGDGARNFTVLYNAASYLLAPRWQRQLAEAWAGSLLACARVGDHEAVRAMVEREDANLDPDVSPFLTMLAPEALATLLVVVGGQPNHPVAGWAERELSTPRCHSQGWLLVSEISGAIKEHVQQNQIAHIVIRQGVTQIGARAFDGCSSLASVTIPDSVTQIGDAAFFRCSSLASVTIPDSVTQIGLCAFFRCSSLASVTIPDSVTQIGDGAFFRCSSLALVTIPDSVTQIGARAFAECSSLASVTIPDSVTQIGHSAFFRCSSLGSVTIPDSVTQIGDAAFFRCSSLASVTIPHSVTQIGARAFDGCSLLASMTVPHSVTQIGVTGHTRANA